MSTRLGRALAAMLVRRLKENTKSFVLIEGVPTSVAQGISEAWPDGGMPQLAVVSSRPALFGVHAMREDVSGTQLRNRTGDDWRGVVLVLCDGLQVPDRQSLSLFEPVSPTALLDDAEGIAFLARQVPKVEIDGNVRHVRSAINQASLATRPSPVAVANYLDKLATGEDALASLPTLGAFRDFVARGGPIDATRIVDNFVLAARRTSDELLRAAGTPDLRKRAEAVIRKRPGLDDSSVRVAVDRVIQELQAGSPELLTTLRFDEAREIFEQRSRKLPQIVLDEMRYYRERPECSDQARGLPWDKYEKRAVELSGSNKQIAAQELCGLDDAHRKQVFSSPTRKKIERLLLKNRSISGSDPSCPEAAIVKAARHFGGVIERVQLLKPSIPSGPRRNTTSGAGSAITVACARMRLGGLFRQWHEAGGEVDGLLLKPVIGENPSDLSDLLSAFDDAGLDAGEKLPALQLRLFDKGRNTVHVEWRPDLDDAGALRAALLFSEQPALTLRSDVEPTLHAFCGKAELIAGHSLPATLTELAHALQQTAEDCLTRGMRPHTLRSWTDAWTQACLALEKTGDSGGAEALALAGAVRGPDGAVALTAFAPLKTEWLAQYLEALWGLVQQAEEPDERRESTVVATTANGIARTTAAHYPAHLRLSSQDRPLLPTGEGRLWCLFGGKFVRDESELSGDALRSVVVQLLSLQPEAAGHLRCLAWGPGAADMLVAQAVPLIGQTIEGAKVRRVEIFCVGAGADSQPDRSTLEKADVDLRGERDVLELRYIDSLDRARELLKPRSDVPAVHLALVTGLTAGGGKLIVDSREVEPPAVDDEVLFAPRIWQRARQDRRTLLMPPTASPSGIAWLRLQNAVEEDWPEAGEPIQVPEIRTGASEMKEQLREIHDLALWVATLDRYATRDSLEQAMGADNVAILHQQKRLGGDSPLSLVLSQKSGGPADRAIGRSLRAAGIIPDRDIALSVGTKLRKVASQGYGILALQAASSGTGINELVGHVVAFSLLATTTTPWPLPPECRVLLVSLDEYRHWFPDKRADLLAIALDKVHEAVHVAALEVKARRSDSDVAGKDALDQLVQTLAVTRWAAYPEPGSIHSRIWLNRIAEAAYAVARESRFKLDATELRALENFRLGHGSLEWAGLGLVFGPNLTAQSRTYPQAVERDIVPIVIRDVPLTQQLLEAATETQLTSLRTVETGRELALASTRIRRRPETGTHSSRFRDEDPAKVDGSVAEPSGDGEVENGAGLDGLGGSGPAGGRSEGGAAESTTEPAPEPDVEGSPMSPAPTRPGMDVSEAPATAATGFSAPILGWDPQTRSAVHWHPAGPGQDTLQNGHVEVWGSSGMGKTQFIMSLLGQLSRQSGSHFGIADFKNDYSYETGFPEFADAEFLDLWNDGAPYNPLALADERERAVQSAVIELRDAVDEAARSVKANLGVRQRRKLHDALMSAYNVRTIEQRWPTMRTLNDCLDDDLAGILGDLTGNDLFLAGEPLGNIVNKNVVFGLSRIPGNGATTILAAGFIFSSLLLSVQSLSPVPNTIRYVLVVDEAHRVSPFSAIQTMIREGRSKGLAVILATQGPGDLPDVVAANAQTKICFGLPDATVATMAARRLDPSNAQLPEDIRTLGEGEAFVSFAGGPPRLLRMAQAWRDASDIGLPDLSRGGQ